MIMRAEEIVNVTLADLTRAAASPPHKRFYAPLLPPPSGLAAFCSVKIEPMLNVWWDHFIDPR